VQYEKRSFLTDALTCPKCNGRMKILAVITEPDAIRKILDHLGLPSEAPRRTAAHPPPQAELPGTAAKLPRKRLRTRSLYRTFCARVSVKANWRLKRPSTDGR
jgi:hypothetical protein